MAKAAPNVLQILTQAIRERRCIALRYHGQKEIRVVEPHAVYTDDRSSLVLDAYQIRGYSSSGRPTPFWRPFRLREIGSVGILKEKFQPRVSEGFSAARTKYKTGLVAIVAVSTSQFGHVPAPTSEMGPPRPENLRRSF